MKNLLLKLTTILLLTFNNYGIAVADSPIINPQLLITAVQIASNNSASEEYISLTNISPQTMTLDNYKIKYSAENSSRLTTKLSLSGKIEPNQTLTYGSYLDDKISFTDQFKAGLSSSGGKLAIVLDDQIIDEYDWSMTEKDKKFSYDDSYLAERKIVDSTYLDSNNSKEDFRLVRPTVIELEEQFIPQIENSPLTTIDYTGLTISELMPNPKIPLLDESDEWIEFYNDSAVDYELSEIDITVSGTKNTITNIEDNLVIEAKSYITLYSKDYNFVLPNQGATVSISYQSNIISSSENYNQALEGQSWSLINNQWQWTNTPSPNSNNFEIIPENQASKVTEKSEKTVSGTIKSNDKSSSKSKAAQSSTKSSKDTSKNLASKETPSVKSDSTDSQDHQSNEINSRPPIKLPLLLFGLAIAIIYAIYEYRSKLAILFRRTRHYYQLSKLYWAKFKWRRGDPAVK